MQSLSDLRTRQRQAGAVFAADSSSLPDDNRSPLHFGDPRVEYAATREVAALFDWTNHALIELTGSDRVQFLHNFCTNDIKRLPAGSGCEAFVTNVKGRILGYLWIEADDAALRLDAGPVATERLFAHLERYIINEDVVVTDRSFELGELLVVGPLAAESLAVLSADVRRLAPLEHLEVSGPSGAIRVSRRDVNHLSAYVVSGPHAVLGAVWERIKDAGARPAGAAVWSAIRIEAGLPIWGVDLTDENLAQEAGRTASAISFTKGCYLGQEPIARLDAMGHVNRELPKLTDRWRGDPVARCPCLFRCGRLDACRRRHVGCAVLRQRKPGGARPGSLKRVGAGQRGLRGSRFDADSSDGLLGSGRRAGDISPPSNGV